MAEETLPTQTELFKYHINSEQKENNTEQHNFNDDVLPTQFEVDLNIPLLDWKRADCYTYHYHICQVVIISIFFMVFSRDQYPGQIGRILIVSVCLMWSISILVIAVIKYYKNDRNNNMKLLNYINLVLGVADTSSIDNIYNIDRKYHGLIFLSQFIHCCIISLINYSVFQECSNDDDPDLIEECMVDATVDISVILVFLCSFLLMLTSYYEITTKSDTAIKQEKDKILKKYSHCRSIQNIVNRLDKTVLIEWKENKYLKKRKIECLIMFLGVFALNTGALGNTDGRVWVNLLDSAKYKIPSIGSYIFSFYISFVDDIFGFLQIVYVGHSLIYHYKFASIIMSELSLPLNCETIDDLFAWWELTKYYKYCVVRIYSFGFSALIGLLLFLSIIAVFWTFQAYINEWGQLFIVFGTIFLIYFCLIAFELVTTASSYHENQLHHIVTLNKERLRFVQQHYVNKINDKKMNIIQEAIDVIKTDIEQNSDTIKCIGVAMNYNFILFLRASAISIVVAYISIQ